VNFANGQTDKTLVPYIYIYINSVEHCVYTQGHLEIIGELGKYCALFAS
jgi:hypothetical protein